MKYILPSLIILISFSQARAQWESMGGPYGSYINDMARNEMFVFAATTAGIYRSADTGIHWEHMSFSGDSRMSCLQMDVVGDVMVGDAVEFDGDTLVRHLFKSTNGGHTWEELSRPPVKLWLNVAIIDTILYAYDPENQQLWLTRNDGVTWTQSRINHDVRYPQCFYRFGERLFLGGIEGDLHIYEGDDANWRKQTIPLSEEVSSVFAEDSIMIVVDHRRNDVFVSEDDGVTWIVALGTQLYIPEHFAMVRDTIYAIGGRIDEISVSADHGRSWSFRPSLGYDYTVSIMAIDTVLLIGQDKSGMTRSTDYGRTFAFSSTGMDAAYVQKLFFYNDQLLTGGTVHGIFNYNFQQQSWGTDYLDPYFKNTCYDIEVFKDELMMSTIGTVFKYNAGTQKWIEDSPDFSYLFSEFNQSKYGLLLGENYHGLSSSLDLYNFNEYWEPFDVMIDGDYVRAYAYYEDDHYEYLTAPGHIARKAHEDATWSWLPDHGELGSRAYRMYFVDDKIYAIMPEYIRALHHLYVSEDHGETWTPADMGIEKGAAYTGVNSLVEVGDYLVCATLGHKTGIYVTLKDDINWKPFNEGLPWRSTNDLIADDTHLYGAFIGQGVWRRSISDIETVSTASIGTKDNFSVFPNPSSGEVYIQLNEQINQTVDLRIYDVFGRNVFASTMFVTDPLDVSLLSSGMYYLTIDTGTKVLSAVLLLQRN